MSTRKFRNIFSNPDSKEPVSYLKDNKGLRLLGFVFMINHIHLLVYSPDVISFLRDFKGFISKEIFKNIRETEPTVLKLFLNKANQFEFWAKTNMPKMVETESFYWQKIRYIHENPVKRNYVVNKEYWYWSSANPDCMLKI